MHHQRTTIGLAVGLALATLSSTALADDAARLKELEQKLEASLKTIAELQKRVGQLETKDGPAPAGTWGARIESVERSVTQLEASSAAAARADTGLPLHGFADVGGGVRNRAAEGKAGRGFALGTLDLYMTPQISTQVKGLLEIAFEFGNGETAVDVERMQLGYVFSDALTLWAGRFHTPYGYWNTAFHHGAQLQTALTRPRFLDFEDKGGIVPAHSVGVWGTGAVRTGVGKVSYDLYAANGNRINGGVLDYQAAGDADSNVAVGFRTALALGGSGWVIGAHGLAQRLGGTDASGSQAGSVRMKMLGGFATYDDDNWEAMAEYYGFSNRDLQRALGTRSSSAWYAQLGRNIGESYTPYLRYERASLSSTDPYFALQSSGQSYRRTAVGLRYNVTPSAALKAEWLRTTEDGTAGTPSSLSVQYSVRF